MSVCVPADTPLITKLPSKSAAAPLVVPSTKTDAPMSGSLVFASIIVPSIIPVCAVIVPVKAKKNIIAKDKNLCVTKSILSFSLRHKGQLLLLQNGYDGVTLLLSFWCEKTVLKRDGFRFLHHKAC